MRKILVIILILNFSGCTFTVWEKEVEVIPLDGNQGQSSTLSIPGAPGDEWFKFIDFNHIVDSIVEIFKSTSAKEAIRNRVHYKEKKRFFHIGP